MAKRNLEEMYGELATIMEEGDEQKAKDFIISNLNDFPENERGEIIMAFFEEALSQQKADAEAVANFQKQGIDAFKSLEEEKAALEKQDKLLEIKESI